MKWRYARRTIDGKRRKVKVHKKSNGNYLVRIVGHRNSAD